jgi:hypothetical protein
MAGDLGGGVEVFDAATGKEVRRLLFESPHVSSVAFSPDGSLLAVMSSQSADLDLSATLQVCDLSSGKTLWTADPGDHVPGVVFSPDGRTLATGGQTYTRHLWEVTTGGMRAQVQDRRWPHGDRFSIGLPAFSPDRRLLATAHGDSTLLLWDLRALARHGKPLRVTLSEKEIAGCWSDLASSDAAVAYRAMALLNDAPISSLPFLQARLKPVSRDLRVADLFTALDDRHFSVRDRARRQLAEFWPRGPVFEKLLADASSAEVRSAVRIILDNMRSRRYGADVLRSLRALETLEGIASKDARQLLESLAGGHPDALLTQEAATSLKRVGARAGSR